MRTKEQCGRLEQIPGWSEFCRIGEFRKSKVRKNWIVYVLKTDNELFDLLKEFWKMPQPKISVGFEEYEFRFFKWSEKTVVPGLIHKDVPIAEICFEFKDDEYYGFIEECVRKHVDSIPIVAPQPFYDYVMVFGELIMGFDERHGNKLHLAESTLGK